MTKYISDSEKANVNMTLFQFSCYLQSTVLEHNMLNVNHEVGHVGAVLRSMAMLGCIFVNEHTRISFL